MHSVTLSRLDDTGIVERQRSLRNRQCSVYASRIRPSAAPPSLEAAPAPDRVSTGLELLPASLSPRWDSLSNGPHLINNSPTSPGAAAGDAPGSELPFQEFVASPVRPVYGPWQQATDAMADPSCTSPRLAASKTMALRTDGRLSEPVPVENFSRPRKPSIRQLQPAIPEQNASGPAVLRLTALVPTDLLAEIGLPTPKTPPWPSSPRPSALPCKSPSPFYPLGPPPVELPDPKHSRVRNAAGASLTAVRPAFTAPASSPMAAGGAPPPWVAADELRSSFRSQLTVSTAFGTTVTERSSVLTKDSSVNSLYASVDEPSLEDVMRMYEKGFADDEDDGDEDDDDDDDDDDQRGRTLIFTTDDPIVSRSDDAAVLATVMSASAAQHVDDIDDAGPPVPPVRSTLDAEIRQSRMIFTSLAFTSSVPALCASAQLDVAEKRDSGKSLDSEPSVASDLTVADDTSSTKPAPMVPPPSAPLSPMAAFRAALEPEDPGSRDRYGFKKQNQFITREQYDTWNKGYTQYLSRRHKKWMAYLRECSLMTDRPIRFPPPNAKTKRFVRKGIPPDWRGAAWFYYAGGSAILAKHSGLYEKLLVRKAKEVDADAIERDLHRTFPDNIQFQPSPPAEGESPAESPSEPPIISSLRRVLHAFAFYNPRIGYCQSLNFLAGLLLLFVETEEQCFWLLNVITIIYLPGTHEMSLEGSKVDLGVLMTELRDTMPAVWDKIGGELESGSMANNKLARKPRPMLRRRDLPHLSTERLPPITLCMTAWFMSCYIGTLPIETTLRVWDVFFYEGSKTLFRIALSIFKSGEAEIKAVADPMEIFGVVQSLPRRMLDANGLMETCFKRRNGFGHLSQDVIDERRQERRDRARQDQALRTGKPIPSGNVTEAETETARRKGTLFGMKLRDGSRTRAAEV